MGSSGNMRQWDLFAITSTHEHPLNYQGVVRGTNNNKKGEINIMGYFVKKCKLLRHLNGGEDVVRS